MLWFAVFFAWTVSGVLVAGEVAAVYAVLNALTADVMVVASPATSPYVAGLAVISVEKFKAHVSR
jgi:hypothetical protein